jgi:hypothetical protein
MASSGYLDKETGEACIEFLVKQCALSDTKRRPSDEDSAATAKANAAESTVNVLQEKV